MDSHEIKPEKMTISLQTKEYYVDISIVCVCVCVYTHGTQNIQVQCFFMTAFLSVMS